MQEIEAGKSYCSRPSPAAIYALSLHDALPICILPSIEELAQHAVDEFEEAAGRTRIVSGRSQRSEEHSLNSSHGSNSYAVCCLKKENEAGKSYCSRRFGDATCDDKSAQMYERF